MRIRSASKSRDSQTIVKDLRCQGGRRLLLSLSFRCGTTDAAAARLVPRQEIISTHEAVRDCQRVSFERHATHDKQAPDSLGRKDGRSLPPRRHSLGGRSKAEYDAICERLIRSGTFIRLNQKKWPGCFYARSVPGDVARVEDRTFICSFLAYSGGTHQQLGRPLRDAAAAEATVPGSMQGRTMYVLPFSMGPIGSPLSGIGVQLTDSAYVVAQMRTMARIGASVFAEIDKDEKRVVPCMHSVGVPLKPGETGCSVALQRDQVHCSFSREPGNLVLRLWLRRNALLSKKCFALRIASNIARDEGWMAEHMLILGVENPEGEKTYVAAAFPSACGKTNFAMLIPPAAMKGWKVWTVGDDIAWIRPDAKGRLRAINPEAGFFGVAPGTGVKTNPMAMAALARNSIFTNVALTPDGGVWWEGMTEKPPAECLDWRGERWTPEIGKKQGGRRLIPTAALQRLHRSAPRSTRTGSPRKGYRSAQSSSGAVDRRRCHWSISRSTGRVVSTRARP